MNDTNQTEDHNHQLEVKSLWNRSFILLILVSLITAMSFNMVYVIISKYALEVTPSLTIAGVIAGIFSIAALIIRPIAGVTADTMNKKRLCIIANLLITIALFGYTFSFNVPTLFFFRILHGVAFGISGTVNIALVTNYIPKGRTAEGIGYYGLGQVMAQIISPNLGVQIEELYGFQPLFLLVTGLSLLGVLLLTRLNYPKEQVTKVSKKRKLTLNSLIAKEVLMYAIIGGMFSFGNGIVSSFLVLLGEERNIRNIGLFFSVGAIVLFVLRIFVGKIADNQGITLIVNISLIASAISMILIGFAPVLSILLLASVLKSIGQGGGQISLQAECIKRVDPSRVGVATSTFYIGADLGQGFGPMIGGAISSTFNYTILFLFCAVLMLVAMLVFNLYQRKYDTA
ncbi:MFS transporter [Amphibacillus xylanus]|uniref:Major facilitator superfamily transporter n=1 Tax=Amphibacillus xylanus (strain ATCC 51415 / DSM 6626 / JCM 7361 / LMG 17667 / NBRC 15112 / Ep01) TaxID=698758 RepID=K0J2E7_AMPXN|nr:MFS transporter [Amphibacillus xylanus]BAM46656.1 major facilitator superfamily transporter [Amphibacillus xylanus NBRC 15112]